jgi:hypothetical protein
LTSNTLSVSPGDQRPLEIEFRRDAQEHVELECVVVGLEGLGRGAAIDRMQHRRLDLHEAVVFHEAADAGDDLRALLETQLRIGVGQDVEMALAVAQFDVGQPVPFFGHRQQRLGEHDDLVGVDRKLAALGAATSPVTPMMSPRSISGSRSRAASGVVSLWLKI